MTFGLTPKGFVAKRLIDIQTDMENAMIAEFGDINVAPQSVFGQLIGVLSKTLADVWDNLEAVYNSQYPATAEGTSLDNVVQLNGIQRLAAQRTRVTAVINATEGTTIPAGSLARIPDSGEVFFAEESTIVTRTNAVFVLVATQLMNTQSYSILIDTVLYTYSLPEINFTGSFVSGNSIVVTLNGTALPAVPFNTDNDTTLADIATAIGLFAQVLTSVATTPSTIDVTPTDGNNVVVNSIQITGGVSQPTWAVTFRVPQAVVSFFTDFVSGNSIVFRLNGVNLPSVPFNTDQATTAVDIQTMLEAQPEIASVEILGSNRVFRIDPNVGFNFVVNTVTITGGVSQPLYNIENPVLDKLAQIINAGPLNVEAVDLDNGTMTINSGSSSEPFSFTPASNLQIIDRSSPVQFLAQNYGPVPAPINTLTEILTPIAGWNSIDNWQAGALGRFIETDAELRIRRRNSIRLLGAATVEAIRARLLQQVPGVTSAFVFENRTLQQVQIQAVFNQDLVTGNVIDITMNGTPLTPVNYAVSHLNTMNLIAATIAANTTLIDSATVGGANNRTIFVNMQFAVEVDLVIEVTGGATQAEVTYRGGRPPKSFEAVVQGGTDDAVALKIWQTKPAGIQTFGNVNDGNGVPIVDSQGDTQYIYFSRPAPIYIWVTCALTLYPEETFPVNGTQLVADSIQAYGQSLGIGVDVLLQRVLAQIFAVPGIASGAMQIAATASPNDSPVYGSNDIPIAENEISAWDLSRISITVAP